MAAGGPAPVEELCNETTCPICLQFFKDPVFLVDCAHNFCLTCLTRWLSQSACCPQCKNPVPKRSFRQNRQLAAVVQIARKLQQEKRVEGKSKRGECERHQAPLNLFCKDDQTSICWVCGKSKEHKFHTVVPVQEVSYQYKEKLQVHLKALKKETVNLEKQIQCEKQGRKACLTLIEEEKRKIRSPFEQMHVFLEKELKLRLAQLQRLEREVDQMHQAKVATLGTEFSHLRNVIKEVKEKCQQPSSEFLQDIGSTLRRCERKQVGYMVDLPLRLKETLQIYSRKTVALERDLEKYKVSLEYLEKAPSKVNVTLDQDTAHPSLILSEDLKSVVMGDTEQVLPDNPERFDFMHCVLGCEAFTSGRHFWEVEVDLRLQKVMWAVGVARESVRRKALFIPSPDEGIWAVGTPMDGSPSQLLAFTSPKLLPLPVRHNLRKIQVHLNCGKKSCVEFFDADTNAMIFTFPSAPFCGKKIRPFFWLWRGVKLNC